MLPEIGNSQLNKALPSLNTTNFSMKRNTMILYKTPKNTRDVHNMTSFYKDRRSSEQQFQVINSIITSPLKMMQEVRDLDPSIKMPEIIVSPRYKNEQMKTCPSDQTLEIQNSKTVKSDKRKQQATSVQKIYYH